MAETIISKILDGKAQTSELCEADERDLISLTGRWDLTAETDSRVFGMAWEVALRVDGRAISGDVFERLSGDGSRRSMRLGGREDWRFSFWGTVKEAVEDESAGNGKVRWLVALCDASHRSRPRGAARPRAILSLRVADGNSAARPEIRLSLLASAGPASHEAISERLGAAPEGARADPAFRRVHLKYAVALEDGDKMATVEDGEKVLKGVFNETRAEDHPQGWTLEEAMAREGIALSAERCPDIGVWTSPEDRDPNPDALLEDALVEVARNGAAAVERAEDRRHDWTLVLIFSAAPRQDEAKGGSQILGRAYGFEDSQNRFRTRFGAIVHVAELEKFVPELTDTRSADTLSPEEVRRRLVLQLAMHELGHLLNLPHCWERDVGFRTLRDAAPASPSYSNYASNWPFGPAAAAHYAEPREEREEEEWREERKEEQRRTQRRKYYREIGLTGCDGSIENGKLPDFDDYERAFLRHAPFDQIAQGGRTFLDDALPAPALRKPSHEEGRDADGGVQIGCLSDNAFRPVACIGLWRWTSSGKFAFPPIPALVRWTGEGGRAPCDFRFESGALQLLIREEPGEQPAYAPERRTVALDPSLSLGLNRIGTGRALVLLPWLTRDETRALFGDAARRFSLQVVYFRNTQESFASNIVEVSFERDEPYPASPEDFDRRLLVRDTGQRAFGLRPHVAAKPPKAQTAGEEFEADNPFRDIGD